MVLVNCLQKDSSGDVVFASDNPGMGYEGFHVDSLGSTL